MHRFQQTLLSNVVAPIVAFNRRVPKRCAHTTRWRRSKPRSALQCRRVCVLGLLSDCCCARVSFVCSLFCRLAKKIILKPKFATKVSSFIARVPTNIQMSPQGSPPTPLPLSTCAPRLSLAIIGGDLAQPHTLLGAHPALALKELFDVPRRLGARPPPCTSPLHFLSFSSLSST